MKTTKNIDLINEKEKVNILQKGRQYIKWKINVLINYLFFNENFEWAVFKFRIS